MEQDGWFLIFFHIEQIRFSSHLNVSWELFQQHHRIARESEYIYEVKIPFSFSHSQVLVDLYPVFLARFLANLVPGQADNTGGVQRFMIQILPLHEYPDTNPKLRKFQPERVVTSTAHDLKCLDPSLMPLISTKGWEKPQTY